MAETTGVEAVEARGRGGGGHGRGLPPGHLAWLGHVGLRLLVDVECGRAVEQADRGASPVVPCAPRPLAVEQGVFQAQLLGGEQEL